MVITKLIYAHGEEHFENLLNTFIGGVDVHDIKFSHEHTAFGVHYAALVMYEDKTNEPQQSTDATETDPITPPVTPPATPDVAGDAK